jgi:hypothetical protein
MDLIRAVLLMVDQSERPELDQLPEIDGVSEERAMYHVRLMIDAGFIVALDGTTTDGEFYQDLSLTWYGHEFLETVRDQEVWAKTKDGAKRVGSWSVGVIGDIAKAVITAKLHSLGIVPA